MVTISARSYGCEMRVMTESFKKRNQVLEMRFLEHVYGGQVIRQTAEDIHKRQTKHCLSLPSPVVTVCITGFNVLNL
jgi:hypothetical protein